MFYLVWSYVFKTYAAIVILSSQENSRNKKNLEYFKHNVCR